MASGTSSAPAAARPALTRADGVRRAGSRTSRPLPGLAPAPQAAWLRSAPNALLIAGSPRLLETVLGAGLMMEAVPGFTFSVPFPELVMIALLVVASFRPPRRDISRYGGLAVLGAGLLVFLVLETVYNDVDPTRRALRIGLLMTFAGAIASERLDVKGLLWGMAAGGLVNVPLFYAGLLSHDYQDYLTGFLGDKNVSGLFYALITPLLLATVQRLRTKLGIVAVGFALTFLTGSRTSLAALFCAVVWVVLSPYLGRVLRLVLLFGMGQLVNWAEENLAKASVFGDRTGTDWFRAQIQAAGTAKANAAPWYGDGLSTATVDLPQGTFFFHNSYLGLITEGGWVFLVVVVGAYVLLCLRPFSDTLRSPSRVAVEAASVVILVTSLQLGEVFITIFGFVLLGIGLLLGAHEAETGADGRARRTDTERIVHRARHRGRLAPRA